MEDDPSKVASSNSGASRLNASAQSVLVDGREYVQGAVGHTANAVLGHSTMHLEKFERLLADSTGPRGNHTLFLFSVLHNNECGQPCEGTSSLISYSLSCMTNSCLDLSASFDFQHMREPPKAWIQPLSSGLASTLSRRCGTVKRDVCAVDKL